MLSPATAGPASPSAPLLRSISREIIGLSDQDEALFAFRC